MDISVEDIEISRFCLDDRHSFCSGKVKRFLMFQNDLSVLSSWVSCECQCHRGVFGE